MSLKRVAVPVSLSLLLAVLVFLFIFRSGKEKAVPTGDSLVSDTTQTPDEPREKKKVTLFFLSERDSLLHPEEREIFSHQSVVGEAKEVIQELLKGSQKEYLSPLPSHTELRELFLTPEGVAHIDFSKAFQDEHPSGSSAETSTVYAVVNSLTYNFKQIKSVFIMVEGGEKETLKGHLSLSMPLLPMYSLIAR